MNRAALHNLIEAYQEARRWKLQAEGLQLKLQTLQDERELSRKKVQILERDLSVLRYNLMCKHGTIPIKRECPDIHIDGRITTPHAFVMSSFSQCSVSGRV